MKAPSHLGTGLTSLLFGAFLGSCATYALMLDRRIADRAEIRGEMQNECYCSTSRTCVFGPGIVGRQVCLTSLDRNEWSRCEPGQ